MCKSTRPVCMHRLLALSNQSIILYGCHLVINGVVCVWCAAQCCSQSHATSLSCEKRHCRCATDFRCESAESLVFEHHMILLRKRLVDAARRNKGVCSARKKTQLACAACKGSWQLCLEAVCKLNQGIAAFNTPLHLSQHTSHLVSAC